MSVDVSSEVEETLASSPSPLTVREIAEKVDIAADVVAEVVWGAPERFSWQPGGRWTLSAPKSTVLPAVEPDHQDARSAVLAPQDGVELRAIVLASGTVLRVVKRPLDSAALFTVKAAGSDLELVLNSAHEAFARLPVPFEGESGDYKRLAELLLTAWAVYEGECPTAARRGLEDARLLWGRKLLELLDGGA